LLFNFPRSPFFPLTQEIKPCAPRPRLIPPPPSSVPHFPSPFSPRVGARFTETSQFLSNLVFPPSKRLPPFPPLFSSFCAPRPFCSPYRVVDVRFCHWPISCNLPHVASHLYRGDVLSASVLLFFPLRAGAPPPFGQHPPHVYTLNFVLVYQFFSPHSFVLSVYECGPLRGFFCSASPPPSPPRLYYRVECL